MHGQRILLAGVLFLLILCGIGSSYWGARGLERVASVGLSTNASYIATSTDKGIRIYDRRGDEVHFIRYGARIAFSPDETRIAVSSPDQVVLYDLSGRNQVAVWPSRSHFASTLAFSPDGATLAVLSDAANTVQIRDANSGGLLWEQEAHDETDYALAFSPDGTYLVTGGREAKSREHQLILWDASTGEKCAAWTRDRHSYVREAHFLDPATIMVTLSDAVPNDFWSIADPAAPALINDHPLAGIAGHAVLSEQRDLLVHGIPTGDYWTSAIALRSVATGATVLETTPVPGAEWDSAILDDAGQIVIATTAGEVQYWDVATGRLDHTRSGYRPARIIWTWRLVLMASALWLIAWCVSCVFEWRRIRPRILFDWVHVPGVGLVAVGVLQAIHWMIESEPPDSPDPLGLLEVLMIIELGAGIGLAIGTVLTKSWTALVTNLLCMTALVLYTLFVWVAVAASV